MKNNRLVTQMGSWSIRVDCTNDCRVCYSLRDRRLFEKKIKRCSNWVYSVPEIEQYCLTSQTTYLAQLIAKFHCHNLNDAIEWFYAPDWVGQAKTKIWKRCSEQLYCKKSIFSFYLLLTISRKVSPSSPWKQLVNLREVRFADLSMRRF